MSWFDDDSWDFEVLCVRQSLIHPGLDHGGIEHVSRVLHGHDVFDPLFKFDAR